MKVYGAYCKNCNKEIEANRLHENSLFYLCKKCKAPIGYYCVGCEQFFTDNRLILHNDLYICKECGNPHYGYTEWKRNKKGDSN